MDRREFISAAVAGAITVTTVAEAVAAAGPYEYKSEPLPGSERYVPHAEATALIQKYTGQGRYFRLNRYAAFNPADPDERTQRYCYPFKFGKFNRETGTRGAYPADLPIDVDGLAEHAGIVAAKTMTVRSLLGVGLLKTPANWKTRASLVKGDGAAEVLTAIDILSGGKRDPDSRADLRIVFNPRRAREFANGPYVREWARRPDHLAAITDGNNPNRKYGLPPSLEGTEIVVENALWVRTGQKPDYVWPTNFAAVLRVGKKPTLEYRMAQPIAIETKTDAAGVHVRIVDDYSVKLADPDSLFPILYGD